MHLLNISKSKFMLLGNKLITKQLREKKIIINLYINWSKIEEVKSFECLGIILDPNLSLDIYCNFIKKEINK